MQSSTTFSTCSRQLLAPVALSAAHATPAICKHSTMGRQSFLSIREIREPAVHLFRGHTLLDGRQLLLPLRAVGGEARLAVVVQPVVVGAVAVEVSRRLLHPALVAHLRPAESYSVHCKCRAVHWHSCSPMLTWSGECCKHSSAGIRDCTFRSTVGFSMRCFFLRRSTHCFASQAWTPRNLEVGPLCW